MRYAIHDLTGRILYITESSAVPTLAPGTGAVIVGQSVADDTHYIANGAAVAYSASARAALLVSPGVGFVWRPELGEWTDERDLEQAREDKWRQTKARRDIAEYGDFTWDGSTFNADVESRNRIMGAVQLATLAMGAGQPYSVVWTLADNTTRTLSATDMMAVGATLGARVGAAHARAAELRAQINAATTRAALDAIDITTGW